MKECNKHEKRPSENDLLRICETCDRHFYLCELCRNSKEIDAPKNICKESNFFFLTYLNNKICFLI